MIPQRNCNWYLLTKVLAKNHAEAVIGRSRCCLYIVELQGIGLGTSAMGRLEGYEGTRMVINSD